MSFVRFRCGPVLAGSLVAAAFAGTAGAAFTGVTVMSMGELIPGTVTYRAVAQFDDPTDRALGLSGTAEVPLAYATLSGDGTLFQSGDFDLPDPAAGPGDSWLSLGLDASDLLFSPGFGGGAPGPYFVGDSWSYDSGGIFDSNPATPINGGNVVIAQFTIDADAVAQFSGNLEWAPMGAGPGGNESDAFSVIVPGPGALAALATAGLFAGARRRRA